MKDQTFRQWPIVCLLFGLLLGLLQACQSPVPTSTPTSTPSTTLTPIPKPILGPMAATPETLPERFATDLPEDSASQDADQSAQTSAPSDSSTPPASSLTPDVRWPGSPSWPVHRAVRTGNLPFADLNEISGLSASGRAANRLWAINDSGNQSVLYAMTREAQAVGTWPVDVRNRDWEALTSLRLNGEPYLLIADIGDNLRNQNHYDLHLIREPEVDGRAPTTLSPDWTLRFRYEDGPHNAEALSFVDGEILIITKEPVTREGPVPGGIYIFPLPSLEQLSAVVEGDVSSETVYVARRSGTMTPGPVSFEAKLAASLASVDLNHATALEVDKDNNRLWVLTYRHVVRFDRGPSDSWTQALARPGQRVHTHSLAQAESLALTDDSLVWLTSEGAGAPLWVLPPE